MKKFFYWLQKRELKGRSADSAALHVNFMGNAFETVCYKVFE